MYFKNQFVFEIKKT